MDILIVEDSIELSNFLTEILVNEGHSVKVASTGANAEKLVSQHPFDICIIDFLLPDCKGDELVVRIEKNKTHQMPKIILSSGFLDESTVIKLIPEHLRSFASFVKKPLDEKELLSKIDGFDNSKLFALDPTFSIQRNDLDLESYVSKGKTFDNYHLINIFFIASKIKFTGKLKINFKNQARKEIYFNQGAIYKISSLDQMDSKSYFGNLLIKNGFVLEEEVEQALKEQSSGVKVGRILLEKGLLSPDMISFILKEQTTIQLSEMISGDSFTVEDIKNNEEKLNDDLIFFSKSDLTHFIIECIQKKVSKDWLNSFYIKNMSGKLGLNQLIKPVGNEHKEFFDHYKKIIQRISSRKTLEQIIESCSEETKFLTLQLIYFGITTGSLFFSYENKEQKKLKRIEATVNLILQNTSNDLFKNLNLSWKASREEIETNYKKLVTILHPDALSDDLSEKKRQCYQEAFKKIVSSYEILSDSEKYKEYIDSKENEQFLDILLRYEKGVQSIKEHDYSSAIATLKEVVANPDAPKNAMMYLLWAEIENQSYKLKTKRALSINIKKQIDNLPIEYKITGLYWFINGLYYKYCKQYERAISALKKSIKIKSNFKAARDEIAKVTQLMYKAEKSDGILSRFFNSKKAS